MDIHYLEFFCMEHLSILPNLFLYSIIYLVHMGVVDIYFILWLTL